ncbi:hypothetical protein AX14_000520 [Amanita brunnescens Koide BX004]|nr:hypothetical protein AX14_000520 [Amanita brunnescens Koide BX004]
MAVEVTATRGAQIPARKVYIKDLILSVVIGVNEPERKEKQRVVVNLEVCEQANVTIDNYQNIVRCISSNAHDMDYFTLERMAWEIASNAHGVLGGRMEKITVRLQKPSALSFARYSGVEITRKSTDF